MEILNIITEIRESFYGSVTVYTKGSCYHFYKILKSIFPDAIAYYEKDHIVTKIGDKFYDITGEVKGDFTRFSLMANFVKVDIKNNKFGITGYVECPNCGEHFKVAN